MEKTSKSRIWSEGDVHGRRLGQPQPQKLTAGTPQIRVWKMIFLFKGVISGSMLVFWGVQLRDWRIIYVFFGGGERDTSLSFAKETGNSYDSGVLMRNIQIWLIWCKMLKSNQKKRTIHMVHLKITYTWKGKSTETNLQFWVPNVNFPWWFTMVFFGFMYFKLSWQPVWPFRAGREKSQGGLIYKSHVFFLRIN